MRLPNLNVGNRARNLKGMWGAVMETPRFRGKTKVCSYVSCFLKRNIDIGDGWAKLW